MRPSSFPTITLLGGLALAQKITNNTDTTICRNQQVLDQTSTGTVNSTGSESFTWNSAAARDLGVIEPWYVSILVNDTLRGREGNTTLNNGGTIAWPYLSVPENARNVSVCLYQFASQNNTSTGNGSKGDIGCAGVLSEGCTSYLRDLLLNQTSGGYASELKCGNPTPTVTDNLRKEQACGDLGNRIAFRGYQDVSNDTCTYPSLPGVDIPDDYVNHNIGASLTPFTATPGSLWANYSDMAYDLNLVQPVPFAIVATFASEVHGGGGVYLDKEIQFVCVTPNNTQPGSRVPGNKTPWENTSAGVRWQIDVSINVVVASMVTLILVW